jgi:hypothetical protein
VCRTYARKDRLCDDCFDGQEELFPALSPSEPFRHPHLHVIATDGAYAPDGTFVCLPPMDTNRLPSVWQRKVFDLLLAAETIDQNLVNQMRSWHHSGFSVDNSVYLPSHDTSGLERLAQYMVRCPFSLARIVRVTDSGSVVCAWRGRAACMVACISRETARKGRY